ncbi:hypothetical protein HG535_0F05560 [Zygotorulaspora mrakii]|uniref:CS domain-containing protein n=1 Tax=Zygotorulaspora mrakii TaxID=42260 RepID=A0A7H9B6U9_ZYGMR|nr:uncharacterized protein HG535_0F05560 [Zygotorulaspora mrakii]QLG74044.1 hypothetical protein HG535_0F05560 [Zygotorulaspora mrakii]
MPIDKDLKNAYAALYDEHDPLKALKRYDVILEEHPDCLLALVYKAASLEKLYYGFSDWHNEQSLENATQLLSKALAISEERGDRSKIGFVYFRYFVHYYNRKDYDAANRYMILSQKFGYLDATLPMWQSQLNKKLGKLLRKQSNSKPTAQKDAPAKSDSCGSLSNCKDTSIGTADEKPLERDSKKPELEGTQPAAQDPERLRTDWYQTTNTIVLSLFTVNLPQSKEAMHVSVSPDDKKSLEVAYQVASTGSEFQYSIELSHEVDPEVVKINVFTKKIELTLKKIEKLQWKILESSPQATEEDLASSKDVISQNRAVQNEGALDYPSSSTKHIDWSKIDFDEEDDENSGSADAFFQKIYADADPDTRRAMMKSFVESNGTALNTNWNDVSKSFVEPSPPEGMNLKHW